MVKKLVGRDSELARGCSLLAELGEYPGQSTLLVHGPSGIGKTALWSALVAQARNGARVMLARPGEVETAMAYSALGDLLDGIELGTITDLPGIQVIALEVASLRREPEGPAPDVRMIGVALANVIRSLALREPVVIAIDDVQWLDDPSADVLAFALRRLDRSRVCVLATQRSDIDLPRPSWPTERVVDIRLGPLGSDDIGAIVAAHLELRLTAAYSDRLARITGGNPLLALEVARRTRVSGDEDRLWRELGSDPDVVRLARGRVRGLPAPTRATLGSAAALSPPRLDVLARLLDDVAMLDAVLAPAISAEVVHIEGDEVRFDHPLLAAAALAIDGPVARRRVHLRLAEIVTDQEERARHLGLGQVGPDADDAQAIEDGARAAAARGAQSAAAELAEAALRVTPEDLPPERLARTLLAADCHAMAGDPARAIAHYATVLGELPDGPERAGVLGRVAGLRLFENDLEGAVLLLRDAVGMAEGADAVDAPLQMQLAYALLNTLRPQEALECARHALSAAERVGAPALLARAIAVDQMTGFLSGTPPAPDVLRRALELEDTGEPGPVMDRPSTVVGMLHILMGDGARARDLLAGVAVSASERGDDFGVAYALLGLCISQIALGDMEAAAASAARARRIADQVATDAVEAIAADLAARVALAIGDVQTARSELETAARAYERSAWGSGGYWVGSLRGSLAWALGDGPEASRLLGSLRDMMLDAGFGECQLWPSGGDLIEALIAIGDTRSAEHLVSVAREMGGDWPWMRVIGLRGAALLRAPDNLDEAVRIAQEAVEAATLDRLGPYERARTLLVLGRIVRRARRRVAARQSLQEALALFSSIGDMLWVRRTESEIDRLGGRGDSKHGLTETETQVAMLAAQGLTNRQIANRAFVTPKSVEGILARAYGKLDIRSRAELGAWAAREADKGIIPAAE